MCTQGAETVKEDLFDDIVKESAPYQPPGTFKDNDVFANGFTFYRANLKTN